MRRVMAILAMIALMSCARQQSVQEPKPEPVKPLEEELCEWHYIDESIEEEAREYCGGHEAGLMSADTQPNGDLIIELGCTIGSPQYYAGAERLTYTIKKTKEPCEKVERITKEEIEKMSAPRDQEECYVPDIRLIWKKGEELCNGGYHKMTLHESPKPEEYVTAKFFCTEQDFLDGKPTHTEVFSIGPVMPYTRFHMALCETK